MPHWGAVLRRLQSAESLAAAGDASLLQAFLHDRSASAFEVLVRRYGTLVLRICQRELMNASDAEDAFQATFLMLAQKAQQIRQVENLAGWLAGVARRIARRLAQQQRWRKQRLATLARQPSPSPPQPAAGWWDEERRHLPQEYQAVIELCLIQGLSREEAALRLGQSPASVHGLLYRARLKLKKQLIQHGTVAGGALVATSTSASAIDRLAPTLAQSALQFLEQGTWASSLSSPAVLALLPATTLSSYTAPFLLLGVLLASSLGWWGYAATHPAQQAPRAQSVPNTSPIASQPATSQPAPNPPAPGFWEALLTFEGDLPHQTAAELALPQSPLPQQTASQQQENSSQQGYKDAPSQPVTVPVPPASRVPTASERSTLANSVLSSAASLHEGMLPLLPHVSKQMLNGKQLLISVITSEQEYRDCTAKAPPMKIPPRTQVMNDPSWDGGAFQPQWMDEVLIVVVLLEQANSVTLVPLPKCWIAPDQQGVGHLLLQYDGPEVTARKPFNVTYPYAMFKVPRKNLKQVAVSIWRAGVKPDGQVEIPSGSTHSSN